MQQKVQVHQQVLVFFIQLRKSLGPDFSKASETLHMPFACDMQVVAAVWVVHVPSSALSACFLSIISQEHLLGKRCTGTYKRILKMLLDSAVMCYSYHLMWCPRWKDQRRCCASRVPWPLFM